ncbi:MAG: YdiU family protein [Microcoleaceae cyanobacterium]
MTNPFLQLEYEPAFESLGKDYSDPVTAAEFPRHTLRFRNDDILVQLGLNPETTTDEHFIEAFGKFESVTPFLAMRYHGYQFGEYNPHLGDGRGFLYGQVRGQDQKLYDFGTKGSGRTPYSRHADGRLTLKGGVREVLAAEALHRMGVRTSRCLSLIETGEELWRGDEPSPTRSSVMVRFSHSHIRFGTFERLHYLRERDFLQKLLDHVIFYYYPHLLEASDSAAERRIQFYAELVQRVAELAAQWMAAGFCHAVLNTDNMSITGESFDYGPYAFIPHYERRFTAAYFDYGGRYCFGNQPGICELNLEALQRPLSMVIDSEELQAGLKQFPEHYHSAYRQLMLNRLGLRQIDRPEAVELLEATIKVLEHKEIGYNQFFIQLRQHFSPDWREQPNQILDSLHHLEDFEPWRQLYHHQLQRLSDAQMTEVQSRLQRYNPTTILLRPEIESIWEKITTEDDWQPFDNLIQRIRAL